MSMRHDSGPLDVESTPSERASSAIASLISWFSLAGALGILAAALYWVGSMAVGFFTRGSWLALSVLGVTALFLAAWFLRSSVLGRLWIVAALVLAFAFLAPFLQRVLL